MLKNLRKKLVFISLLGMLSTNILACSGNTEVKANDIAMDYDIGNSSFDATDLLVRDSEVTEEQEIINTTETIDAEENSEIPSEEPEERSPFISVPVVIATTDVNIRDGINGNKLGVLPEGHNLELLEVIGDTHYKVMYYGQEAYIVSQYAQMATIYDINSEVAKIMYADEPTQLLVPSELSESGEDEYKDIPKYECFEVYEELENSYLVKTSDYVGYIPKENLKLLDGTFVMIDLSDQNLKMYENNDVILDAPVITGKPGTSTPVGTYSIFEITHDRYLIGKNNSYRSWVSIMMNFNGNIGLHDAEYHVDEDGRVHGWRAYEAFGGNTYLTNGSHGCVNMRYDDVMYVNVHTGLGTMVLVKK